MSMYRRNIRIDVTPGAEPKVIHVSQYDRNSRTYAAQLYASGAEFTVPEGATVAIIGTKPDGHGFDIPAALEGDTVTFSLHEQMTPVAGRVPCKLTIEKDGAELLTERFILSVDRTALDLDTIKSDSEIRQIAEIQGNFGEIIEAAESIREGVKTAEEAKTAAESASEAAETARKAAEKAAEEASAAKSRIDEADLDGKLEAIATAAAAGVDGVNAARTNAVETVDDKAQEVARMKVNAEAVATQALSKANNLENSFAEVEQKAIALQQAVARVQMLLDQKADDGYADSKGYLHLTSNGDDISDPIGPFATGGGGGGGGGGGSDDNVTFTARNVSGWNAKSIKAKRLLSGHDRVELARRGNGNWQRNAADNCERHSQGHSGSEPGHRHGGRRTLCANGRQQRPAQDLRRVRPQQAVRSDGHSCRHESVIVIRYVAEI